MSLTRSLFGLATLLVGTLPLLAQDAETPPTQATLTWEVEVKTHYRDSDDVSLPIPFPRLSANLPPGAPPPSMQSVDPGSHFEVSTATLFLDARWSDALQGRIKVDVIDLYDRNPTSEDKQLDVDEVWLRFGRETPPALLPQRPGAYLKIGKFGKFERQNDRHLESYGLASTAFNRFEDAGIELGVDLGRYVYLKATATQGNPVFMRDPTSLAGDNGVDNRENALGSGIVILYDAEVEDLDVDGELEVGAGVGVRFANASGTRGVDLLLFGYQRDLAERVALEGTFYGGDLDLLRGPENMFPFGLRGIEKTEQGANLWVYLEGFSLFGQFVDQDIAGLIRKAVELEVSWTFDLPVAASLAGRQLFPWVAPAVRYSELDPEFPAPPVTPSPSFAWDWEKTDFGVRLAIVEGIDLTFEHSRNRFTLKNGRVVPNDETLATLRWRM